VCRDQNKSGERGKKLLINYVRESRQQLIACKMGRVEEDRKTRMYKKPEFSFF